MTLRTPSHARPSSGQPPGAPSASPGSSARSAASAASGANPGPRRRIARTTPTRLRLLMIGLLLASLAWGAVGAWAVSQHASAAQDVVSTSEPLSLSAQQMYRSLSDADVTATAAFLSGPYEPLAARQRYAADISQAATDLSALKNAASASSDPHLLASLSAVSTGLPVYAGDVSQAQTEYALGYLLTGGSFMQVASGEMHLTLLPAARAVYAQENDALTAQSARATGLPWIALSVLLAAAILVALYRVQRWLGRRTHRIINAGLLAASAALAVALLWTVIAFAVARADLGQAAAQGSAPAELLARASIDAQRVRGDEVLNLISRSGDSTFVADYQAARRELGPRAGTLLTQAAQDAPGSTGAGWAQAAGQQASAWYAVNDQAYRLDAAARYPAETALVTGTGAGSSATRFAVLQDDLTRGIAADQVVFEDNATAGRGAFGGLAAGIVVATLVMALATAFGLARRLAEYR